MTQDDIVRITQEVGYGLSLAEMHAPTLLPRKNTGRWH